ncbi:contact-dependent growth inhibition system immunity protein [Neobacillus sp. CF12]|uniref:contact-dependent growth inhibition system immunity protein n=1 Tax=Neobacillus sp. CF12 TaxID=3055864 RepID=UPI0025A02D9A|nr:contact-dependent growth inhibition system immunity protein [Neobacillus sp. CF12]MDM5330443.1 contact-dependent growth inhibition system immunity protein [Neobacillus sp. CF12]
MNFDINKSLEELEDTKWKESDFQSNLILKCQELRKKKLKDFTIEDLRIMIGQKIGLKYLVPLALETLVTNPFVEGDLFMGDLLEQVLKVDKGFWNENEDLLFELNEIISLVKSTIKQLHPLSKTTNYLREVVLLIQLTGALIEDGVPMGL